MNILNVTKTSNSFFINIITKYFLLFATIFVILIFGLIQPKIFDIDNLMDILRTSSVIGMMAVGLSIVMSCKEIDFAVGAEASFVAVIVGKLLESPSFDSYLIALFIGMIAIALIGFVNSILVIRVGIPSFIATLGISALIKGLLKFLTDSGTLFSYNWPNSFTFLGQGYLLNIIPIPIIVYGIIALAVIYFTDKTKTGRYIYAIGANPVACTNVGINVKSEKTIAFILCALVCGFSGVVQSSTLNSASYYMGDQNLLNSISTMMLGATFLKPGMFNVPGTVVASILMAVIANVVIMLGATFYMKDIVQGGILLLSIGIIAKIRKEGLPSISFIN